MQILNSLLQRILGSRSQSLQESQEPVQASNGPSTENVGGLVEEEPTDSVWLSALPAIFTVGQSNSRTKEKIPVVSSPEKLREITIVQMSLVQDYLEELSNGFNKLANNNDRIKALHVTSARFTKQASGEMSLTSAEFPRYRLTCGSLSLIVAGQAGIVEIFELPADQLFLAAGEGRIEKRRLLWHLKVKHGSGTWFSDGLPLDGSSRKVLLKQLFLDFVKAAWQRRKDGVQTETLSRRSSAKEQPISVQDLIEEKQNLVNKLLSRDEELTSAIARDLHDVVIAEIMLLKGRLTSDPAKTSTDEILEVLDRLTKRLREICYNLTPRDLADWGLKTVLEDLAHQFGKQNETPCAFKSEENLPTIEHAVQLQIYRIVQEGLNNAAKYAEAKNVSISLSTDNGIFRVSVEDDGKGFEVDEIALRRSSDGGSGLHDLRDRTELIRCFHPARLAIISEPGQGTTVSVEINLLES